MVIRKMKLVKTFLLGRSRNGELRYVSGWLFPVLCHLFKCPRHPKNEQIFLHFGPGKDIRVKSLIRAGNSTFGEESSELPARNFRVVWPHVKGENILP